MRDRYWAWVRWASEIRCLAPWGHRLKMDTSELWWAMNFYEHLEDICIMAYYGILYNILYLYHAMNQNRYSPNISDCGVILVPRCFAPMMFVTFLANTQALDFGLKLISVLTMQALPCPHAAKQLWQPSLSWTRWSSAAMQMPHAVCWEVTAQTVAKQCVYTAPSVFRVWSLCPSPWIWGCRCWFSDTQKKRQQSHLPRPCHCCPEILRFANGKATIAVPIVVQWVLVPGWCSPVRSLRECTNAFHQTIILIDGIMIQWSMVIYIIIPNGSKGTHW